MKHIYIILAVVVVLGYFFLGSKSKSPDTRLTNDDITSFFTGSVASQDTVILYSTAWCGYCKKSRELFEQGNVRYKEYDIEKDSAARAAYKKLKGRGVPLIEANGRVIRGYNKQLLQELVEDERYQL